jgi:putative molybdopterin biosynthesis protein
MPISNPLVDTKSWYLKGARLRQPKIFHRLVGLDEAVKIVVERARPRPIGVERVRIEDALYRVLAEDIYAPVDHPPFDRSEVDGYAVKSYMVASSTELSPTTLRVAGYLGVGDLGLNYSCEQGAVRVSTGSAIPPDCDAVVMEEYTERRGDFVEVYRPVAPGENISTCGSDISAGDFILPKGTMLRHEHIALLAGVGIREVLVYIRPRIAVFSTGAEVVEPGRRLPHGRVYDVNGFLITQFLRELGADARYMGILPDDYDVMKSAIERAILEHDAVFTSGGTSAGEADLVYRVFEDLGEVLVHGLKSKPGKPTVIAVSRGKLLFGLPGFPLSCYMILTRVVKPIVAMMTGYRYPELRLTVKFPFKLRKGVGKTWLIPSILVESKSGYTAYPVSLSSGSVYAIAFSDGFVELDENVDYVEEDSPVTFYAFTERYAQKRLTIIGSNDPLLERHLVETGLIYRSRILNAGSTGGWIAVSRGEADIAPTHLLDEETGLYNVPFLDKYGLRGKAILIRGYERLIGFVVQPGNPKGIASFEDFFRSDVKIVNRVRGSGVRTLIDINLKKIAREKGVPISRIHEFVKGYTYEVKTHTAVAYAVKTGKADVGVASGLVAELYGLDFIPLTWEEYDFLIPLDRLEKSEVKAFISSLKELKVEGSVFEKYYRIPRDIGEYKS